MKYRWAVLGVIGGLIFLLVFSYKGGMALWIAMLYFLIFYLLSMSIARVRAEVGSPAAEMHYVNPRQFFPNVFGTRLPPRSLTMIAVYVAFNRGYRAHPMPHTLEGFKLAEASQMNARRLFWVMLLATVMGTLTAFWAYLVVSYKIPANPVSSLGNWGYEDLQRWLYHPTGTNPAAVVSMVVGFLFTGFLWWLRTRFSLWAVHPAGYAITHLATRFAFGWIWFSIFISWGIKLTLLRVGGIRLYRKALPPFPGAGSGGFSRGWGVGAGPVVLEGRSLFFLSLNCLRACFKIDDKAFFGHSSAITCRAASAFKGWCAVRTLRDFARKEPRFEEKTRFQGKSSTRNEFSNRLLARLCTFKQYNRRCQSSVEEKRERF